MELKRQAKEAGLGLQAYFFALLEKQKGNTVPLRQGDPFRPENKRSHQRLEALLNRLDDTQRDQLWHIIDAAFPAPKEKRAS